MKLINEMINAWHRRRVTTLTSKLEVQIMRCKLLEKAERDYKTSYYTDRFHEAVCERVQIASALKYHQDCAGIYARHQFEDLISKMENTNQHTS